MIECVINVSEGRDQPTLDALAGAAGPCLLDLHADADHHRSVLTLGGESPQVQASARALATEAVARIDLGSHAGSHPRLGAVDVVPFVPLDDGGPAMAVARFERDAFARWAADELGLPCFLYGDNRPLPEIRRRAFVDLAPDTGPTEPHPRAGACCVGARPVLVAYNVWLTPGIGVDEARRVAAAIRGPQVRVLGLQVGDSCQVSFNLIDPLAFGPARAADEVASRAGVARTELVGLLPAAVLRAIPHQRWEFLDVDPSRTIEARLGQAVGPGCGG